MVQEACYGETGAGRTKSVEGRTGQTSVIHLWITDESGIYGIQIIATYMIDRNMIADIWNLQITSLYHSFGKENFAYAGTLYYNRSCGTTT